MSRTPDDQQSFFGHLTELRRRLIFSSVVILIMTALSFTFSRQLLHLMVLPLGGVRLKAFNLMDGFFVQMRIALFAGITLTVPIWLYQGYRFVLPALYPRERKALTPFLTTAVLLFFAGVGVGYYMLQGMIRVLIWMFPPQIEFLPSADSYISFVVFFLLVSGFIFLFPAVIILLVQLDIISTGWLRKQRKVAYFILFVIAEIITPVADPIVAPLTFMLPLVLLFEGSMLIGRRIERKRARREAAESAAGQTV